MIFQHTLDKVLAGTKTATSRLWKDNWAISFVSPDSPEIRAIYSCHDKQPFKRLRYEVGQILSAQPARGQKGVAKIRILELQKRDVRYFTSEDVRREGYTDYRQFIQVWTSMHNKSLYRKAMRQTFDFYDAVGLQDAEYYTALFIRFELVQEGKL